MSAIDEKIDKILEKYELFYARVKDKTYVIFKKESDLEEYLIGGYFSHPKIHRTGEKSKVQLYNYLSVVDMDWLNLKLKCDEV